MTPLTVEDKNLRDAATGTADYSDVRVAARRQQTDVASQFANRLFNEMFSEQWWQIESARA
jgi:hypothetical protein